MHEMTIAQGIIDIALKTARENGAAKISGVKVLIGAMSGIDEISLKFGFDALTKYLKDIDVKDVILDIDVAPVRARCRICGKETEFENRVYRFVCPDCDSPQMDLISGNELKVIHVDVE